MDIELDRDWKYLGLTVAVILLVAGLHNVTLSQEDALSFGYCDTELYCAGAEVSGVCLGVEQRSTQCQPISTADDYRRVEAECGALAYNYCSQGNYSGTEWASQATYRNKTCRQWAKQDERITLLSCDQTTPPVSKWDTIR
ncbi:MAG: hypothetical protein SV186_03400 [Candidatus Nanohaloarchaea archaeon]|nr:hypothetical protein [Candidatus Nanohaloarchaea archaeon]